MKHTLTLLAAFLLVPLATLHAAGTSTLPGLFTDHMILQRDAAVAVWGWTKPGAEVTVEFAGHKKTAKADAAGKWMVRLDPLPASAEPRELKVGDRVLRDVLVGDVWLCTGQSNMGVGVRGLAQSGAGDCQCAVSGHPALHRQSQSGV